MTKSLWIAALVSAVLFSCGKEKEDKEDKEGAESGETPPDDGPKGPAGPGRTVIFIDDGFDVEHPVFAGKIAGTYTITCDETEDSKLDPRELSPEELKKELLAAYADETSDCEVVESLKLAKSSAFSEIAKYRETWNETLLAKKQFSGQEIPPKDIERVLDVITGKEADVNYHGTATAGVTAFENPSVKLVLIQFELAKSAEDATADVECWDQATIDRYVDVILDPEVFQAYVEAPVDPITAKLNEIAAKHGATIANLSLGSAPRVVMEQIFMDKGCGKVDLAAQFKAEGERELARSLWLNENFDAGVDVLTIQSAGNDNVQIDSLADTTSCSSPETDTVVVGSHDYGSKRSEFSNYGSCVDLFAFGEGVLVAAPDGFLNVSSGTSFSAPMVVRYLTQAFPVQASVDELREALIAKRDARTFLPAEHFPTKLAYPDGKEANAYALTQPPLENPEEALRRFRRARRFGRILREAFGR